jgi:excisionase family DNA binding protein
MSQELITVQEAAEILKVTEEDIRERKGETNTLTHVEFGKAVRLIRSEVEELISRRDGSSPKPKNYVFNPVVANRRGF